jgi:predicted phage terminase large subunit-like protein
MRRTCRGTIIKDGGYVHLCIPFDFEPGASATPIWSDPRHDEDEPAWPARFPEEQMLTFRRRPYMWAGQYQQRPEPRGGGIFKRAWWQVWNDEAAAQHGVAPGKTPSFSYVIGVLDTAYTEREENDPCAMTTWGVWHDRHGVPQVSLVYAWEEWLEFNALVERAAKTCTAFKVDRLIVEAKASGISVAQELRRRYSHSGWAVETIDPGKGDKVARAYAVTSFFEDGIIWVPAVVGDTKGELRKWAEKVVDQMSTFPKGAHDDLVDTATMAIKYLRDTGLLLRAEEHSRNVTEIGTFRGREKPLYQG